MVDLRSLRRFDELRYAELFTLYLNREEAYVVDKSKMEMTLRRRKGKKKPQQADSYANTDREIDMTDTDMVAPALHNGGGSPPPFNRRGSPHGGGRGMGEQ